MAPPASTPNVAPLAPTAPQMPSALLRSAPSGNRFITIDSAAGSTAAAPRPWTPRMMIRNVALVASAQANEAAVNSASPAVNIRRRPSRSAVRPPSSRKPPKVIAYAVTTHCRSVSAKCSLVPIVGRATLTISMSTTVMKHATASSANARHRCSIRAASGARARCRGRHSLLPLRSWVPPVIAGESPHRMKHRTPRRFVCRTAMNPARRRCCIEQKLFSRRPTKGQVSP